MSGDIRKLLLLPHIHVHNANALSSPYTIGFPAMTAWLGCVHALQRKLNQKGIDILFDGVAVVSHRFDLQTYRGENDFVSSIVGTGNPLDKSGARSAFIEEARCHMDVSLVIELSGFSKDNEDELLNQVVHLLNAQLKVAGGDIKTFDSPKIITLEEGNDADFAKLTRKLMPGYVIVERRELMIEGMKESQDATDALIDYLAIHHHCEKNENGVVTWHKQRKTFNGKSTGWVVPIATGFQGVSDISPAKNQRDPEKEHRFAESVVTLGEFKMPYRFHQIDDMLWHYHFDQENDLYLCQQNNQSNNDNQQSASFSQNSIVNEFE